MTYIDLRSLYSPGGGTGVAISQFHSFFWPFHNSQRNFYHFHIHNFLYRNGSKNIPISQFSNFSTIFCLISQFTTYFRPFSQITTSFQFTISQLFLSPFSISQFFKAQFTVLKNRVPPPRFNEMPLFTSKLQIFATCYWPTHHYTEWLKIDVCWSSRVNYVNAEQHATSLR